MLGYALCWSFATGAPYKIKLISIKDVFAEVLDIRRDSDYEASKDIVPGAIWKDPAKIENGLPLFLMMDR
ncbi:MAG: hypothetical protein U9N50_13960 [Pseudomonadota bacterium]|nr:hypothetical protein [Pseudomonadota bacterium]